MSIVTTANEINKEAFEVLFRELGVSRTIRFINQYSIGNGNYIEMKDKIFNGMTVEDIVSETKHRPKKNLKKN
jgi:hypothetical protein